MVEGIDDNLIRDTVLSFSWGDREKSQKISVRIASLLAEFSPWGIKNMKQNCEVRKLYSSEPKFNENTVV
jgi:hypothetical protein